MTDLMAIERLKPNFTFRKKADKNNWISNVLNKSTKSSFHQVYKSCCCKKTSKALHRNKHIVSISEARIFKTLSITEAEQKKADAYKKKV